MKLVFLGLSITSSWGNGHASTYRALLRALNARGHRIIFFECNQEWYASNRDLPEPEFCDVRIFDDWDSMRTEVRRELRDSDVAVVGSYFPEGARAVREILDSPVSVKAFYDIDTPITVQQLRTGSADYLRSDQVSGFDVYFSFTGGPLLHTIQEEFGARKAVSLYCSFDPQRYYFRGVFRRYQCDMSYMGTYAPDRQPKLERLFWEPARRLPKMKFLLAGPQYPRRSRKLSNVRRIIHLSPRWHSHLYSSSRLVLNVTRREMIAAGYSPSVRLFEAAACGAALVSDTWPGIETFFTPGEEILLAEETDAVVNLLKDADPRQLQTLGKRAQARILAEHTSEQRAIEFEEHVAAVRNPQEMSSRKIGREERLETIISNATCCKAV